MRFFHWVILLGYIQVSLFINDVRTLMNFKQTPKLEVDLPSKNETAELIIEKINEQNELLSKEMDDLKRLIAVDKGASSDAVVYVGNDMEILLNKTEKNLESKLKLQVLLATVCLYAAISVSIPLIATIFRGS